MENAWRLKGGLAPQTAAVVGVIANLAVWFLIHVLFARVGEGHAGPIRIDLPEWSSFDWRAVLLAALSAMLIFRIEWNVIKVLGISAIGGLLLGQIA